VYIVYESLIRIRIKINYILKLFSVIINIVSRFMNLCVHFASMSCVFMGMWVWVSVRVCCLVTTADHSNQSFN